MQNSDDIFISQTNFLKYFLKRFGFEICKPIGTQLITGHELSRKDEIPIVERKKYRSMTGGLQ